MIFLLNTTATAQIPIYDNFDLISHCTPRWLLNVYVCACIWTTFDYVLIPKIELTFPLLISVQALAIKMLRQWNECQTINSKAEKQQPLENHNDYHPEKSSACEPNNVQSVPRFADSPMKLRHKRTTNTNRESHLNFIIWLRFWNFYFTRGMAKYVYAYVYP